MARKNMGDLIVEYFSTGRNLRVLDGANRENYQGVTVEYIHRHVLKNRFTKNRVIGKLIKLHSEEKVKSLRCGTVKDIVFHRVEGYRNFDKNRNDFSDPLHSCHIYSYKYFIDQLKLKKE